MLDAAALAAILDPERKVQGWWSRTCECPNCGRHRSDMSSHCFACDTKLVFHEVFNGPPDLPTAREHNWRLEDWLEARGMQFKREWCGGRYQTFICPDLIAGKEYGHRFPLIQDPNHTAALVAAIERIHNEVR